MQPASIAAPQLHSPDCLVRLARSELAQIVFEHVCTTEDEFVLADAIADGLPVKRAGTTEWMAHKGKRVISLAWDWLEANDGALCTLRLVPPRTNLRLLTDKGYDMGFAPEEQALWERIACLDWAGPACEMLALPPLPEVVVSTLFAGGAGRSSRH